MKRLYIIGLSLSLSCFAFIQVNAQPPAECRATFSRQVPAIIRQGGPVARPRTWAPGTYVSLADIRQPGMFQARDDGMIQYQDQKTGIVTVPKFTRRFPFSLVNLFKSSPRSMFPAMRVKLAQNITDFNAGLIEVRSAYFDAIQALGISHGTPVAQVLMRPTPESFLKSEVRAYRAMYHYIKIAYSPRQLRRIKRSLFSSEDEKSLARTALEFGENEFVAYHVARAYREADYGHIPLENVVRFARALGE